MTDAFLRAIAMLRDAEGGLVDNPRDPGGITHHGISLRFALGVGDLDRDGHPDLDVDGDGDVDAADIRAMPWERASEIYRQHFWTLCRCDGLPWPISYMTLDEAVNQGRGPAIVDLQTALGVKADGRPGPITLAAAWRRANSLGELVRDYAALRALRYARTANLDAFGLGWYRRLFRVHAAALAA